MVDSPLEMVSDVALKEWESIHNNYPGAVDTLFLQGNIACATSTGGITGKRNGRVGDSPLIGCGGYSDSRWGGVSVTGHGESLMKVTLSRRIIFGLESGQEPLVAVENSLEEMLERQRLALRHREWRGRCVVHLSLKVVSMAIDYLSVAALQFNPQLAQPEENRKRVQYLIQRDKRQPFQYLVLPEMCFTGYSFTSKKQIQSLVEPLQGPTLTFCSQLAIENDCYISAGFPEVDLDTGKYYNSVLVTNPRGQLVHCYRKTFLYETDKHWAEKGTAFRYFVDENNHKVACGICMDINPEDFLRYEDYEFASYCASQSIDIILFSSAWIGQADDLFTLDQYWYLRLKPLWGKPCIFVGANRIGKEGDTQFIGQSCILSLQSGKVEAQVSKTFQGLVTAKVPI
ncbi:Isoaspartyl peptidase/L-asparaginase [Galdieria sulphuraria]|nr:Isoaspartyl peptidase/L-asparaginase [Galdieria sulphuraria]